MTLNEFRKNMRCGLGRCYTALESGDMPKFKPIVLHGCINNIAFDTQCEGSRGNYMHSLAARFGDNDYFVIPAAEKFLNMPPNGDWHKFCHLCDFLKCFAEDGGSAAEQALKNKYSELYSALMNTRSSQKTNDISDNYEYLCIDIMQISGINTFFKIAEDIGGYFIRRKNDDTETLRFCFDWFYFNACEKFGKKALKKELKKRSLSGSGISRFFEIMETETVRAPKTVQPEFSSEDIIQKTESGLSTWDRIKARRLDESERIKLANAVLVENDPDKKAELLKIFCSKYCKFPINPEQLIGYTCSENDKLRAAAFDALSYTEDKCVHDFAAKLVMQGSHINEAIPILIGNYEKSDKELLLSALSGIKIDLYDSSGWHGIVIGILNAAEKKGSKLPSEALMFVYENSLCSRCRENALKIMGRRHILTDELLNECLFDCNCDIRKYAEKRLKQRNAN